MLTLADAVAAPARLRLGWRCYWACPLTLEDLGIFDRIYPGQKPLGRKALGTLVWLSVRRLQPGVGLAGLTRSLVLPWRRRLAWLMLTCLNPTLFVARTAGSKKKDKLSDVDFTTISQVMAGQGFLPTVWKHLTSPQIELVLAAGQGPEPDMEFTTLEDAQAAAKARDAKFAAARGAG